MATIPESEMPAPRLELRWENRSDPDRRYTCACIYSLVLKLGEHDIRAEREDAVGNRLPNVSELRVEMGKTLSTGDATKRFRVAHDEVDTPFRDGAHANWDTAQLGNLPIYVVAAGRAMRVEPWPKRDLRSESAVTP